jgi:hypothetical protein
VIGEDERRGDGTAFTCIKSRNPAKMAEASDPASHSSNITCTRPKLCTSEQQERCGVKARA